MKFKKHANKTVQAWTKSRLIQEVDWLEDALIRRQTELEEKDSLIEYIKREDNKDKTCSQILEEYKEIIEDERE